MMWIRTKEALEDLARSLEGCRAIGLDTESDSLYHHREKVCLVQVATDGGDAYLVDSLAVDLAPLATAMASPRLVKVLHGADYDVTTLKRDYGFRFEALFDTMLAARLLGRTELGLLAVARDELGVTLSKTNQKDDWSRRPLTPQQEAYALADVTHLVELRARLEAKLAAAGRLSWLREECDAVAALEPLARRRDPDAYLGVKGARRLAPRALAALRELHAWRERRAEETDTPAFRILGNETLVRLAEALPGDAAGLRAVSGVLPRLQRQADEILAAIRRARELQEAELPAPPRAVRPVVSDATLKRIERLKAWRARKGQELALDGSVLLPQRLIEKLAETAPADLAGLGAVEGLRRWRVEAFGGEIVAAVS
jgi:ribonuclease D